MSDESSVTHDNKNQVVVRKYEVCCAAFSKLRFSTTCKKKVNKTAFNRFKQSFDHLFTLTGNLKAMKVHDELTEKVKSWLTKSSNIPSTALANSGIELFDEYQKALISTELINNN